MSDKFDWIVEAPVSCPSCGHEFVEKAGRLNEYDSVGCPECGFVIDTTTEEWRAYINKFLEGIESARSLFEKLPKRR